MRKIFHSGAKLIVNDLGIDKHLGDCIKTLQRK